MKQVQGKTLYLVLIEDFTNLLVTNLLKAFFGLVVCFDTKKLEMKSNLGVKRSSFELVFRLNLNLNL